MRARGLKRTPKNDKDTAYKSRPAWARGLKPFVPYYRGRRLMLRLAWERSK